MKDINNKLVSKLSYIIAFVLLFSFSINVAAQQDSKDDFSFVFMTDIHLKNEPLIVNSYRKAISKINALNPDFVLSGGDQVYDVMRGNEKKADSLFTFFKKESKAIKSPLYTSVGNHDLFGIYKESPSDSTHAYYKYALYEKYFGKTYYSFEHKGWHFVVLNVLDVKDQRYIASFDKAQLAWLEKDLKSISKETPVVIMLHIPIVSVQNQIDIPENEISEGPSVVNKKQLLDILKPYNLKIVLQGHLHYSEDIFVSGKTHYITGGAIAGRPSWRGLRNGPRGFLHFKVKNGEFEYSFIDYENNKETKFK